MLCTRLVLQTPHGDGSLAQVENAMYVRMVRGKQINLVLAAPALLRHLEYELNQYAFGETAPNAGDPATEEVPPAD